MINYDKQRLIKNLYHYIKLSNYKVGDLEAAANVSTGYLSRWKNDGNDSSSPTVETLTIMADKLAVSLDTLLFTDIESLNSSEIKIIDYLNKFIKKTESEEFEWERITINQAYSSYKGGFGESVGKLPFMVSDSDSFNNYYLVYKSLFNDAEYTLAAPLYKFSKHSADIFITCIQKNDYKNKGEDSLEYELYLDSDLNGFTKICNADENANPEIRKVIKNLYDIIAAMTRTKLDTLVESELNSLFNDDDNLGF